jgi:hypothetical protein
MRSAKIVLFVLLGCLATAHGQSQPSPSVDPPHAGCYEVVSLVWNPPNDTIHLIPNQFQLLSKTWSDSRSIFVMHSLPADDNLRESLWTWEPKGDRVRLSWSTGFGGF